jgi:large conductance mechanosensitive channel
MDCFDFNYFDRLECIIMKKIFREFKDFALRGNVLDLAVGVIIGAAFQNLVKSLTTNIISPILGCFSEVDFSSFSLKIGNLNLTYGAFITDIINFIIMAFVVFLIVKFMNKLAHLGKKEDSPTPVKPSTKICPHCFSEININANRCPFCTSELIIDKSDNNSEVE